MVLLEKLCLLLQGDVISGRKHFPVANRPDVLTGSSVQVDTQAIPDGRYKINFMFSKYIKAKLVFVSIQLLCYVMPRAQHLPDTKAVPITLNSPDSILIKANTIKVFKPLILKSRSEQMPYITEEVTHNGPLKDSARLAGPNIPQPHLNNTSTGNTSLPLPGKTLPTKDKGGVIDNYADFYNFMVEKAIHEPVEVTAWMLYDIKHRKAVYFVLPWQHNSIDESGWDEFPLRQAGYSVKSVTADYHTHPRSTGPSFDDLLQRQRTRYPSYTIGADGRVWEVFYIPRGRIIGRYLTPPGQDPNCYRYGKVVYEPE